MKIFIYKLYCKDKNIKPFYIGSTKNIKKRIEYHNISSRYSKDDKYHRKMYKYIRENGGFQNWTFEILKIQNITNTKVQRLIERMYFKKLNPTLNVNSPIAEKFCVNIDLLYPLIYKIACVFSQSSICTSV